MSAPFISYHRLLLIPEEMVMEILLNLPSKSLIRFKSVCKPWCTLFSSSQFMAKHLLPDRDGDGDDNDLLVFKRRDKTTSNYVLSLLSNETLNVDHSRSALSLPPYPDNEEYRPESDPVIEILGSCCCHGLMCISYRLLIPYLVLWRPATGDVRVLPPSQPPLGATYSYLPEIHSPDIGFGYDATSHDYKVIRLNYKIVPNTLTSVGFNFEIYSFNSDSWTCIDGNPAVDNILPCGNHRSRTYTNGVFSWWASDPVGIDEWSSIVWFRMSDESFGTTKLPPSRYDRQVFQDGRSCTTHDANFVMNFLVLNDRIALVMFDHDTRADKCFNVWVMLEFGVEDSWTRLFAIGPLLQIERVVWFWKNGKIIMENSDGDLVLYDPFNQEMKPLNIGGSPNDMFGGSQIVSIPAKHAF